MENLTFEDNHHHEDHEYDEHDVSPQQLIMYGSIRIALASIGLIANVIQMLFCINRKQYRTKFDISVISLSVADTISSVTLALKGLVEIFDAVQFWDMVNATLSFSIICSIAHTIFIAVQRLLAVIFPLKIRQIFRKGRFHALLAFMWITCGAFGIIVHFVIVHDLDLISRIILVSGTTLIVLYTGIAYVASRRDTRLQNASQVHNNSRNTTIFLHSFLVTLSFVGCFFPLAVSNLFMNLGVSATVTIDSLLTLNPFIDSTVYFYVMYFQRRRRSTSALAKYSNGIVNVSYVTGETEQADQTVIEAEEKMAKPYIIGQKGL